MKLVIHCGFHKTGSTTFQLFCHENREQLRAAGVYYPQYRNAYQHSYVLWDVQKHGLRLLCEFLLESYEASVGDCHTMLLSGEDFENCIYDVGLASEIENLAFDVGFTSCTWVAVTRPIDEYLLSLYAEKSKYSVVLTIATLRKAIQERGCFFLSTESYNYIFIFDINRFRDRFHKAVSGKLVHFEFQEFVDPHPGYSLLKTLLPPDKFEELVRDVSPGRRRSNPRLDYRKVELNYIVDPE